MNDRRPQGRLILEIILGVFAIAVLIRVGSMLMPHEPSTFVETQSKPDPTRPVMGSIADIEHAVIISVDGLRPDLLLLGDTPNLKSLLKRSSYTMWARTTDMAITLPSHTSMVTGVKPETHRLLWNDKPLGTSPEVPTLFDLTRKAGMKSALVAGKDKFKDMARLDSVDWMEVYTNQKGAEAPDMLVAQSAADILRRHEPDLIFIHFPAVDAHGHKYGWGSKEQMGAIARADAAVGHVLKTLDEMDRTRSTLIIISADHGGQGKGHGPNDMRSRHIPWIVSGPGIRRDYDLTLDSGLHVNTEDTFGVTCQLMGLTPTRSVDAKRSIQQILYKEPPKDLMHDVQLASDKQEKKPEPRPNHDSVWQAPEYRYEPMGIPSHH